MVESAPTGWMLNGDGGEKVVSPDLFSTQEIIRIWNTAFPVELLLLRLINQVLNFQVHAVQ